MSLSDIIKPNNVGIATATKMALALHSHAIKTGRKPQNMFIHGPPGCGKSAMVSQLPALLAETINRRPEDIVIIDLRLSAMEAADVLGIPYVSLTGEAVGRKELNDLLEEEARTGARADFEEMRFSTPAWFPKDDGKIYIVFLDELSNCSVPVQQAAYRLVLDRQVQNGSTFPASTFLIAAGNQKEHKTGAKAILPALANRFAVHLYITQFGDTITHFIKQKFNPDLIAFLESENGAPLYGGKGNADNYVPEDAYATPRTWEEVHYLMENPMFDTAMLNAAIAGCVGSEMATRFLSFLEYRRFVPDYARIRKGDPTYEFDLSALEQPAKFAIGITIGLHLRETLMDGLADETENLCRVLEGLPPEILVIMFRSMVRDTKMPALILKNAPLREHFRRYSAVVQPSDKAA